MRDLHKMTPVEIDTELARIWGEIDQADAYRIEYAKRVRKGEAGDRFYATEIDRNRKYVAEYTAEIDKLRDEARPYEDEFTRRGGWLRYFLVTNGNGHVHREMTCHTCYPTTRYAWLIDLADCDEDKMIEEWGEKACTVCFPDAPVNPFYNRPARVDREAREARDAEKAKKAADKNEKAITDVDGEPLRVDGSVIRTKVAARNELSGAVKNLALYGPGHPSDFLAAIRKLVPALEAAGVETEPVIARAIKASVKEGFAYAGQVADMIAGVELTEAIESGNDLRMVEAVEKLGATVTHRESPYGTPYGTWFRISFPMGPREAARLVLAASDAEEDTNVSILLDELGGRFFKQASGLGR